MADFTSYKLEINDTDYPVVYNALVDNLELYATEIETARGGEVSLWAQVQLRLTQAEVDTRITTLAVQQSGLTADLSAGSNKITNLADAVNALDATNLQTVQGLIAGGAAPGNIPITDLGVGTATSGQVIKINGAGTAVVGGQPVASSLDPAGLTADQSLRVSADGLSVTAGPPVRSEAFTASGTWTRPSGVGWVDVLLVGGGGGGGRGDADSTRGGGGGGGGQVLFRRVAVSAATYTVTIGAGGAGGTTANGGKGNDSTFGSLATARGGQGGRRATDDYFAPGGGNWLSNALLFITSAEDVKRGPGVAGNGQGGGGGGGGISGTAGADSNGFDCQGYGVGGNGRSISSGNGAGGGGSYGNGADGGTAAAGSSAAANSGGGGGGGANGFDGGAGGSGYAIVFWSE